MDVTVEVFVSHSGGTVTREVGYHATPRENVSKILREGLLAHGATALNGLRIVPAVHMEEDEGAASGFIQGLYELDDPEVAVFRVDLRGLRVREGWDGPGTLAVEEDIPVSRLTLLH